VAQDTAVVAKKRSAAESFDWGSVELDLNPANNVQIDFNVHEDRMRSSTPHGTHAAIVSQPPSQPMNPLIVTCRCLEADTYLLGIRDTLTEAARRQLTAQRAGFLCVYVPEVESFEGLQQNTGIAEMTRRLFESTDRQHVAAVAYSSEDRQATDRTGLEFYTQALVFKNANCSFPGSAQFRFLEQWSGRKLS
jgi:hypothetical protein